MLHRNLPPKNAGFKGSRRGKMTSLVCRETEGGRRKEGAQRRNRRERGRKKGNFILIRQQPFSSSLSLPVASLTLTSS